MTQKARESDRNAAITLVQSAFAVGEIIEADRDKRIEQLQLAQTLDEIRMITHDIQSSAPEVPEAPAADPIPLAQPAEPPPYVPYGPPATTPEADFPTLQQVQAAQGTPKLSKAVVLVPLAVVLVIAVALIGGIVALAGEGSEEGSGPLGLGSEPVDVLSEDGYRDLLDAVRNETGDTTAFSAVLYPTYAVVELPVDATTQREAYWYWDGSELTDNDTKSASSFPRTDLAQIDAALIVDLVEQVRTKVEDPTSWYAIVRAPDSDRAVVWAYASNEYQESEYIGARRDGTITYDSTEN
ncbi:DUF1707 domain-containing protein [Nocardioides sp. SR21]|uniref:DUF1707 domain-containing protein n=1 Tax=Nocardioides sp. SR21 TaxID=2919501 RepID=UPI001FAA0622|nr:DUF1707 domain-containing protein [Nocardioides sp. SR21]